MKLLKRGSVLVLCSMLLVGCSGVQNTSKVKACKPDDFKVGVVVDRGGVDDRSFNEFTFEGVRQAGAQDDNICYNYLSSATEADYETNLATLSNGSDAKDLVIASGYTLAEPLYKVASAHPEVNYLIIDAVVDLPNVTSAVFAEHEGSFLVGVAAGLKAKEAGKDTVGFLGGMEGEIIGRFEHGFIQGVHAVHPQAKILVEYAGSFADVTAGKNLAAKMYDEGAYIIFHASGGTGNGLISEAVERAKANQEVFVIGVDSDQFDQGIYDDNKSVILTSMIKRVDTASKDVTLMVKAGDNVGGKILEFTVANQGLSLPDINPNLSDEILAVVKDYTLKVSNSEITVKP